MVTKIASLLKELWSTPRLFPLFPTRKIMREKPVIFVIGCTGTGKSDLGVAIAQKYGGEVISADSMQIYQGLDIATNKITKEEMQGIPHHMMSFFDPSSPTSYNVHNFREASLRLIEDMQQRNLIPVIVGGTTYYVESLLFDDNIITTGPDFDKPEDEGEAGVRTELRKLTNEELHAYLEKVDPKSASRVHPNNRHRVLRAIEIYLCSGKRKSEYLSEQGATGRRIGGRLRFPHSLLLFLDAQPNVLESRLDCRVDKMIAAGLKQEIHQFYDQYSDCLQREEYGVMQCIGLKEFMPYLKLSEEERSTPQGEKLFNEGCEWMKIRTRQYARKQRSWFDNRIACVRRNMENHPIVRTLDTSDKNTFLAEGLNIVQRWMEGDDYSQVKYIDETKEEDVNMLQYCEFCEKNIHGMDNWKRHVNGKFHKYTKSKKMRFEETKRKQLEAEKIQREESEEGLKDMQQTS